jgi:hypothetical protein
MDVNNKYLNCHIYSYYILNIVYKSDLLILHL